MSATHGGRRGDTWRAQDIADDAKDSFNEGLAIAQQLHGAFPGQQDYVDLIAHFEQQLYEMSIAKKMGVLAE